MRFKYFDGAVCYDGGDMNYFNGAIRADGKFVFDSSSNRAQVEPLTDSLGHFFIASNEAVGLSIHEAFMCRCTVFSHRVCQCTCC